jgi:hypothetical protein
MAKGSHTTRGGWEPKACDYCGRPVRVTGDEECGFEYDHRTGTAHAWHAACGSGPKR